MRASIAWLCSCLLLSGTRPAAGTDFDVVFEIPLRVHLLRSQTLSEVGSTLTTADVERILGKVNTIWGAAGIRFRADRIVEEPPARPAPAGPTQPDNLWKLIPPASFNPEAFNLYYIRRMNTNGIMVAYGKLPAVFVKDTSALRQVPGGIDEPIPRVTSHELGHALGLSHREAVFNLMASGTTATALSSSERLQARLNASTVPWIRRVQAPDTPRPRQEPGLAR